MDERKPFRTPGYDGPEGTEWPRPAHPDWHVWGHDTHYPPTGDPHHVSRCGEDCPPKGQH